MHKRLTKIFPIFTGSDCVIIQQVLRNQTPKTSPYCGAISIGKVERGRGILELLYVNAIKSNNI